MFQISLNLSHKQREKNFNGEASPSTHVTHGADGDTNHYGQAEHAVTTLHF